MHRLEYSAHGPAESGHRAAAIEELEPLDAFVDPRIRRMIEEAYYAIINRHCSLPEALKDPLFLESPTKHVALFSDHGVVHVRDVARQILQVLDIVHGKLIPARDPARFEWMKACAILIAYVHDIGMIDPTPVGRAMHPEYATQAVLGPRFDEIFAGLWAEDRGGFAARIARLQEAGALGTRKPMVVLREILAMANCHSKSKVPVAVLNNPARLRRTMVTAATTDLQDLYRQQHAAGRSAPSDGLPQTDGDWDGDAFAWIEAGNAAARALVDDVVDTLRALRCADALRQRGTVLKTSGNYEVFVDERTANAIYALRPDDDHLYLLEVPDPISSGEANLSSSQLETNCHLRISFYHGRFEDQETVVKAARSAALVVNDIREDAIGSFVRSDEAEHAGLKRPADLFVMIESVNENPEFADLVCREMYANNPDAPGKALVVQSLEVGSTLERARYLHGTELVWSIERRRDVLSKVALSGHRTETIDPVDGFREVRLVDIAAGDRLIEAGTSSGFVYIPLGEGLRGRPLGGYEDFTIKPWILLGVTGVIRGAIRNASVLAEQDTALLAIPKGVFLDHWQFSYDQQAFAAMFKG